MSDIDCGKDIVVSAIVIDINNKLQLIISGDRCKIDVRHADGVGNLIYSEFVILPNAVTVTGKTLHLLDNQFNKIVCLVWNYFLKQDIKNVIY